MFVVTGSLFAIQRPRRACFKMAPASMRGSLRPNQSTPHSYVFLALLLMVVVLAFNYWSSSSKNSELLEQLSSFQRKHKVCYDEVQTHRKTSKNVEDSLEKTKRELSDLIIQINKLKMSEKGYIEQIESCGRNISLVKRNYEDLINKTKRECEQQVEESRSRAVASCSMEKDNLKKSHEEAIKEQSQQLQQQQQKEEQLQIIIQQQEEELRKLQAKQQQQQQQQHQSRQHGEGPLKGQGSLKQKQQTKRDRSQKQGEDLQKDSESPKQGEGQQSESWSQTQGQNQEKDRGYPKHRESEQSNSWSQKQGQGQQKDDGTPKQGENQQRDSSNQNQEGQQTNILSQNPGDGQQKNGQSQNEGGQQKEQEGEGQQKDSESQKHREGQLKNSWNQKQAKDPLESQPVQKEAGSEENLELEQDGEETTKPTREKKELEDASQNSDHAVAVPSQDDSSKERKSTPVAKSTDADGTLAKSVVSSELQQPNDTTFQNSNTTLVLQPPEAKDPELVKLGTDHAPGHRPAHWIDRARRPDEQQQQMQQGSTGIQSAGAFAGKREKDETSMQANKTASLEGQRGISTNVEDASEQQKMIGKPGQREVAGAPGQLGGITNLKGGEETVKSIIHVSGYTSHGVGQGEGQNAAEEERHVDDRL